MSLSTLPHIPFIIFFFALGACVGSFLNVVVWRLPRNESIVSPPSHCPKCGTRLAWYDNIPVFGWIALRGKCRYCGQSISARYPIIEAITGGLFVLYYVALFVYQEGPCAQRLMTIQQDWPLYSLYIFMVAGLLASSLIDAEHYIIPIEIPWIMMAAGLIVHTFIDMPAMPGALNASSPIAALSAGAGVGLILSILLLRRGVLPLSFADGAPLLEFEKKALADKGGNPDEVVFTPAQVRQEMYKEILFLLPPLLLGAGWMLLTWRVEPIARMWRQAMMYHWISGFLGALWGALVGAFLIWFTRIAGSLVFGREAMGLGDVHLMLGIGAVVGAMGATVVFFIAPFFGLLFAIYKLIVRRGRELPYGPYLSLAAAVVVLFYCRIMMYLEPSIQGLMFVFGQSTAGGGK